MLITTGPTAAQPAGRTTAVDRLRTLEVECERAFDHERALAVQWALQNDVPLREVHPDGRITEIVSVTGSSPTVLTTFNATAAQSISADEVYSGGSAGLALNGAGVVLHEWDGGGVRTSHVELIGAVTWADDTLTSDSDYSDHSTHVAGTMVGLGAWSSARGMAFAATVDAYDWGNDTAEMAAAAAAGARISNHSYGYIRGWYLYNLTTWYWYGVPSLSETEDVYFGFYDSSARSWDQVAYNAPYYLIYKSAGNDRNDAGGGGHYAWIGGTWTWTTQARGADGGALGYDSIGSQGCAKNIMTVGAINDVPGGYSSPGSVVMSSFSGWGPTDDGRIKPDIVANGIGLLSSVAGSDTAYSSYSGTSMASPSAAGGSALLVQHYRLTHGGSDMRAATLKGLIIHTTDEAGAADGPDYQNGWGLLSVETASQQITLDVTDTDAIQELSLAQGQTIQQTWSADGATVIKATICWTDPAGTPVGLSLDPPTPMLVNDLDLRIIGPGNTVYEPWILNPADPAAAATRGDNFRDNVEVVMIDAPPAGAYRLEITHKGTLVNGSQEVTLILDRVDTTPAATPFILWRNSTTNQHVTWFMDGTTLEADSGSLPMMPSADWSVVGTGDFDGDGKTDLMWRNLVTGQNRLWFMTGTSLAPDQQTLTAVNTDWSVAATADFDADGKCDIFWRNSVTGQNILWFMDGTTLRPETGLLPYLHLVWEVAGSGDFDGDGARDVWWRHSTTGQNAIWFLDGTALTTTTQLTLAVISSWRVEATEDFDGDGKTDVLWRNSATGGNAIWFMDGATLRAETGALPGVPLNWHVAGVADFDSDGDPEVLWRNTAGHNYLWFMQGTSRAVTGSFTTTVAAAWDVVTAAD